MKYARSIASKLVKYSTLVCRSLFTLIIYILQEAVTADHESETKSSISTHSNADIVDHFNSTATHTCKVNTVDVK